MSVRLKKEYVEKFNKSDSFVQLTEKDRGELKNHIAPLVASTEKDEYAKRFDNFMYGFMIAYIEHLPTRAYMKNQLCQTAALLEKKANIPQIQQKINLIKDIQTDDFWQDICSRPFPPATPKTIALWAGYEFNCTFIISLSTCSCITVSDFI
ncbi:MAG: hypothetical protein ACI4SF_08285 [Oscillospiraceae bacterium]